MKYIILLLLTINISTSTWAQGQLTEDLRKHQEKGLKKRPAEVKKIMDQALANLRATGIDSKSLKKAPSFSLDGKPFSKFYKDKPVILKFYRGHWCPYCQIELKSYQSYNKKIEEKGYQVIVITPDKQKYIDRFKKKMSITIPIYSDENNSIAKKFGITFKLSKEITALYKKFGIDLKESQGNVNNELPLPGTYIINKKGVITYAFIDADYTKRLDPEVLLKKL